MNVMGAMVGDCAAVVSKLLPYALRQWSRCPICTVMASSPMQCGSVPDAARLRRRCPMQRGGGFLLNAALRCCCLMLRGGGVVNRCCAVVAGPMQRGGGVFARCCTAVASLAFVVECIAHGSLGNVGARYCELMTVDQCR